MTELGSTCSLEPNITVCDMVCLSVSAQWAQHRSWNMSQLSQPKASQVII